jgi:hypothetical protein
MKSLLAATLVATALSASPGPAIAQACYTAETCRAIRLQQQAAQEQAAVYAQKQAAMAAQQQRRAEAERKRAAEQQRADDEQARIDGENRAAASREAQARAKLVEETRIANLRAAEESPENLCKEPSTAGQVINYYNSLVKAGNAGFSAIDIEHLITEQFDPDARTMSCHGTFVLTNGNRRMGSIVARTNVAGSVIVSFHETQD